MSTQKITYPSAKPPIRATATDAQPEGAVVTSNSNSEDDARAEKAELADKSGLAVPAEGDPKGLHQLFAVLTVMSKDTPNSHSLFSVMGHAFTVGGLRSLFQK